MKKIVLIIAVILVVNTMWAQQKADNAGWISLFDGKTLNGWKVGKNASTFHVENGSIVANGDVAHLFYD